MNLLVADDDRTSLAMLAGFLRKHGYEVTTAENGVEAWERLRHPDSPRLAILDWMMPELNGSEVCQRLRTIETDQPPYLILLTSRTEKEDVVDGLRAGANDYLAKPFHPEELRARIEVGRRVVELQASMVERMQELQKALAEIRTLRGIIPICAHCKKIRDDQGYWKQVEVYVRDHTEANFSHGICPACLKGQFAEIDRISEVRKQAEEKLGHEELPHP